MSTAAWRVIRHDPDNEGETLATFDYTDKTQAINHTDRIRNTGGNAHLWHHNPFTGTWDPWEQP